MLAWLVLMQLEAWGEEEEEYRSSDHPDSDSVFFSLCNTYRHIIACHGPYLVSWPYHVLAMDRSDQKKLPHPSPISLNGSTDFSTLMGAGRMGDFAGEYTGLYRLDIGWASGSKLTLTTILGSDWISVMKKSLDWGGGKLDASDPDLVYTFESRTTS